MKFVDPTQPYRKFESRVFLKKSRTSLNFIVQSRSENAFSLGGLPTHPIPQNEK
jgi:hypothetical protein